MTKRQTANAKRKEAKYGFNGPRSFQHWSWEDKVWVKWTTKEESDFARAVQEYDTVVELWALGGIVI